MKAEPKRRIKPLSGNKTIDWHFIEVVNIIEHVWKKVHLKKVIKDTKDRRKRLYGFLADGHEEAYVVHQPPIAPAEKNLLHEALHAILDYTSEDRIRILEAALWDALSCDQKKYLADLVPKHYSKKEPCAA